MLGTVLAGTAAAAAVAAGYQSMAPTGQWYGRTFTSLPRGTKQIALTYDDGPNDPHTLRLLEVFAKHGVHATFFLIGRYVQQRPDVVREIVKAGLSSSSRAPPKSAKNSPTAARLCTTPSANTRIFSVRPLAGAAPLSSALSVNSAFSQLCGM
jgi:peptidoglycan/xylan/chitin deacetylase (PgdA/CDA1 family)